ncbi:hypothetical protein [Paracoccus aerius]|uniref:Uncharacterized protein n=1 Tax=Paracoccus aerius TaxID=1915382 RepID=A0ABS1S993_9RHOB|nr:hypothetical protein [Paracoccus aerius]MBL3674272.1 hypothetical protein [Paracoccus aerius]GHG24504.1 hypothetical protein GCM10017322_23120 [Paracoccus aerius]
MPINMDDSRNHNATPELALEFIEVGQNEDGEHVILLTGTFEAVQAAGRLYGRPVLLVLAKEKGGVA